jgi:hemerythrin-like metal-binding protein
MHEHKITWDDSLSVDVTEIDEDHRRLVDLFNLLVDAVADDEPSAYIDALLKELISCTDWHFKHEERLMLHYNYSELEGHRAEHQDLIDSALQLRRKFDDQDKRLGVDDIEYLSGWLTEHILGYDMKLGFYLLDRM